MTKAAYLASKNVFLGKMNRQEAINYLSKQFGMAVGSSGDFITNFQHMVHGKKYTRTFNEFSTDYFFTKISDDFELETYRNAIRAGYLHVEYYAQIPKGGNLRGIKKILDEHSRNIEALSVPDLFVRDSTSDEYQKKILKSIINNNSQDTIKEKKKTKTINGHSIYPRNPAYAKKALNDANYSCEISSSHETFIQKFNQTNFTEAHHLVPLKYHSDFEVSLDIPANIISLCPNCHRKLHFGQLSEIKPILKQLLEKRFKRLECCRIKINYEQLIGYYK